MRIFPFYIDYANRASLAYVFDAEDRLIGVVGSCFYYPQYCWKWIGEKDDLFIPLAAKRQAPSREEAAKMLLAGKK